jgi:hypothetical protein
MYIQRERGESKGESSDEGERESERVVSSHYRLDTLALRRVQVCHECNCKRQIDNEFKKSVALHS